jgi:hypothetical protein
MRCPTLRQRIDNNLATATAPSAPESTRRSSDAAERSTDTTPRPHMYTKRNWATDICVPAPEASRDPRGEAPVDGLPQYLRGQA